MHPEIIMNFYMSHELITPLMNDDLDIIIDCKVHHHRGLRRVTLFREKYVVVCSGEYRSNIDIQSIDDLNRCAILSIDPDLAWWHHFIFSVPEFQRPSIQNVITINHIRGIITAVKAGIGVAFVPQYCVLNEIR
ncbi:substrate-binding domain-containing protein [bacterium]|nr:substrate-binding domain-containing protein [candidate division CSSED10-310 bacterium]